MGGLNICLISPNHLATNPRLLKEARALTSAGHSVSIVCGSYTAWGRDTDAQLIDSAWRVTQVPFGPVVAPRLIYLAQSVRRRLARGLVDLRLTAQVFVEAAHAPVVPALVTKAAAIHAHLYIAHYVAALPAAANAARTHSAQYAFDAEDYHLGDLPDIPEHRADKDIIRRIEAHYLPGAAYITAASPMIADAYADIYPISKPTVLLNVFPKGNAPPVPPGRSTGPARPSLYWFSRTIGPGRGLECAIEAIGKCQSAVHLHVRGTSSVGYDAALSKLAQDRGVANRLHFLPLADPGELERAGAAYDLGYSGETGFSPNNKVALGNKLFSYLLSGLPVIASDTPAHRAIAPHLGPAMKVFPAKDATALAAAIDTYLLNPKMLEVARAHAWTLAQERYNWEAQQCTFLRCVASAVRKNCAASS